MRAWDSIKFIKGGIETFSRFAQQLKARDPTENEAEWSFWFVIKDLFDVIVNVTNDIQWEKALLPIEFTIDGISTSYNETQPLKADSPIKVKNGGIITSNKNEQSLNDSLPIDFIDSGSAILGKVIISLNNPSLISCSFNNKK